MVNFEQPPLFTATIGHWMTDDTCDYERLCDEELAAADQATCKDPRIEHLEKHQRNAWLAS